MKWNELTMKERAEAMRIAVANGVTKLDDIKNTFDDGGYLNYMEKLAAKKAKDWGMSEDETLTMMLNSNEYNYKAFYDNNRETALKMLTADPDAHFTDIGKTVYHPTFSNESIYSGKKSDYNPRGTIGGSWKGYEYVPSESQLKNKDFNYNYTNWYLTQDKGKEFISDKYSKYEEGGPLEQQLREQYPHYTNAQIQLLIRNRQAQNNLTKHKETSQPSSKDYSRDVNLVMGALHDQANSLKDMGVKEASTKQEQEAKDKWAEYKLGIEAGTTAAELLSGTYFLTKGALKGTNTVARRLSRTTSRYGHPVYSTRGTAGKVREATDKILVKMDKGQTAMNTLGFGADILQLLQGDTSWINNAELTGDAAGIIGGTNIVRDTPWFGRHRKAIDTTLDAMGYAAAGYDVLNYLFGDKE